jgi:polyisoprenoid-binding protein YceI
MPKWTLEPGHSSAEFSVRHMMVTFVRGHLKGAQGTIEFDPGDPGTLAVDVSIDAAGLWSGDEPRDEHLKNADFLDVENHPEITFKGSETIVFGSHDYRLTGDLKLRGVTKKVELAVRFLGTWGTPWWQDGEDKGPKERAGFEMRTTINRQDFGIAWQAEMDGGGVVVGNTVEITIDAEGILQD